MPKNLTGTVSKKLQMRSVEYMLRKLSCRSSRSLEVDEIYSRSSVLEPRQYERKDRKIPTKAKLLPLWGVLRMVTPEMALAIARFDWSVPSSFAMTSAYASELISTRPYISRGMRVSLF